MSTIPTSCSFGSIQKYVPFAPAQPNRNRPPPFRAARPNHQDLDIVIRHLRELTNVLETHATGRNRSIKLRCYGHRFENIISARHGVIDGTALSADAQSRNDTLSIAALINLALRR